MMLCQLDKNCIGDIAGMNGDIGVDKVSRDRATPSIPPSQRNFDRLPLFDAKGLWHAAQGGNRILQTVASRDDCEDVTEASDFKIDVGIRSVGMRTAWLLPDWNKRVRAIGVLSRTQVTSLGLKLLPAPKMSILVYTDANL